MIEFPTCITKGESLSIKYESEVATAFSVYVLGPSSANATGILSDALWTASIDTSPLAAGSYSVEVWATIDGDNVVVGKGKFELSESLQNLPDGYDGRSTAERIVSIIETFLESNGATYQRYKINNRELQRYSIGDLLQLLNYYKRIAVTEKRQSRGKNILGPRIEVRI